jgi:TP901 family phage tail tape measure protein
MAGILGALGKAIVSIEVDASTLSEDLGKLKGDVQKQVGEIGGSLQSIGAGMTASLTVPILAIGAAAVASSMQIDDALDSIRISTGATGDKLEELTGSFEKVFADVPDSAETVATAIGELNTRTGATGPVLEGLATQVLNLARVAKSDLNSTIQNSTRMFGDWSIATNDQAASLDTVFKVSQQTGIGVDKLMSNLVAFGAPLRQMNFTFEESAVMMGKWEKEGVNAELVLGSMRIAIAKFAEAGVPLRKGLDDTIKRMKELGPGAESTSLAMEVFGKRAGPDMAAAILEGRFELDSLMKSVKSSPETINKAAKDVEGFSEKFGKLKNQVTLALEPLGTKLIGVAEDLMPVLTTLAGILGKAIDIFTSLPQPVQNTAIAIAGIAAAAGPVVFAIGGMISMLPSMAAGLATAKVALTGMGGAAGLASGALAGIGIAIAAWSFAKIYEATGLIIELWQQTKQADSDAKNFAKQGARAMEEALKRTGLEAKDHAEALDLLRQYSAGLRGETSKVTDESSKLYAAWQRGTADARVYANEKKKLTANAKDLGGATSDSAKATTEFNKRVAALKSDMSSLDKTERSRIVTLAEMGDDTKKLAKDFGVSEAAIKNVIEAHKEGEANARKHSEAIKALNDQFSGKGLIENAMNLSSVLKNLGKDAFTKSELEQMAKTFGDALEKMVKTGQDKTPQFKQLLADWMTALDATIKVTPYDNSIFWTNFFKDPPNAQTGKQVQGQLTTWMNDQVIGSMKPTKDQNDKFWKDLLGEMPDVTPDMSNFKPNMLKAVGKELTKGEFALEMGQTIVNAIVTGRSAEEIGAAIGGLVGTAIGLGISSGNPIIAQALGTAGALIGEWIGGLFGGDDEEQAAVKQMRDQMLAAFGGLPENFREIAKEAGVAERQINVLLQTGDPEDFRRHWDAVQPLLQQLQVEYEGLGIAIEGTNTLAEGLAMNLQKSIKQQTEDLTAAHEARLEQLKAEGASEEDLAKMRKDFTEELKSYTFAATEDQQIAIDRLGTFMTATFADMVRRTGDAASAILAMKPAFETVKKALNDFGLEGNHATKLLIKMYDTITDNEDVFTAISGTGKLMEGLGQALVTNKELGNAFGEELAYQFKTLTDRGVDSQEAMAMMQPQLQKLWEHQQKFGSFTDEATEAMVNQAKEAGIVGPEMRDVNKQILDVLIEIKNMFANDIPGAIPRTQNAINSLKAPDLRARITYTPEGLDGGDISVEPRHGAARGIYGNWGAGTPVMLHGPEVVMPLDRFEASMDRQWDRAMSLQAGDRGMGGEMYLENVIMLEGREMKRFTTRVTQEALLKGEIRIPPSAVRTSGVR